MQNDLIPPPKPRNADKVSMRQLLDAMAEAKLALNLVGVEMTQGFNTMPRGRDRRDMVEECMAAEARLASLLKASGYVWPCEVPE